MGWRDAHPSFDDRVLAVTVAAGPAAATPAAGEPAGRDVRITVMETSDMHGNALNWDYFKNAEYDDSAHDDVGLAKVSTLAREGVPVF